MHLVRLLIRYIAPALLVGWLSGAAIANNQAGPVTIIEATTARIMAIVREAPAYFDDDPERFYSAIEIVLDETIDWRGFARGVMGEYASNARYRSLDSAGRKELKEQLESFTDVMKSNLVRTYAKGLLAFSGSEFEIVKDDTLDPKARSASVTQLVYGTGDRTYTLRYQMGRSKSGSWRMRNLIVEDINLGQIYQSQFSSAAKSAGGDLATVIGEWDISSTISEDSDDE